MTSIPQFSSFPPVIQRLIFEYNDTDPANPPIVYEDIAFHSIREIALRMSYETPDLLIGRTYRELGPTFTKGQDAKARVTAVLNKAKQSILNQQTILSRREWKIISPSALPFRCKHWSIANINQMDRALTAKRNRDLIGFFNYLKAQNPNLLFDPQGTTSEQAKAIQEWLSKHGSEIENPTRIATGEAPGFELHYDKREHMPTIPRELLLLSNLDIETIELAFEIASHRGDFEFVNAVIQSERFSAISRNSVRNAFRAACTRGYFPIVQQIVNSHRFTDIDAIYLSKGLSEACAKNHLSIVHLLLPAIKARIESHPLLTHMEIKLIVDEAFLNACKKERISVIRAFIEHDCLSLIDRATIQNAVEFSFVKPRHCSAIELLLNNAPSLLSPDSSAAPFRRLCIDKTRIFPHWAAPMAELLMRGSLPKRINNDLYHACFTKNAPFVNALLKNSQSRQISSSILLGCLGHDDQIDRLLFSSKERTTKIFFGAIEYCNYGILKRYFLDKLSLKATFITTVVTASTTSYLLNRLWTQVR